MKTENHYTETDLGNISLNPRGEYNPEAFYEYLDTVNMDGGSYMCLAELGTKITGTPPVPGINTEHWQVLTLPGGLTPEYITMHDEVIEKAKQVEVSRAAVELSQSEIEAMQADVAQLHKDTQDSAQSALVSKNQAAGYASAADTSRQAAERAKQDVDAQIPNIDAKLQAALNEIDTTRQSANTAVKKQEELSVQAVKDQTGTYITEQKNLAKQELDEKVNAFGLDVDAIKKQVSDEGAKQVEATRTAGNTAVQEIGTVKSTAVQEVQTEGTVQTEKVSAKGTEQVQAVADTGAQQMQLIKTEGQKQLADVQQAAQEIVADREQINVNKKDISDLKKSAYTDTFFRNFFAMQRTGKKYTVRFPLWETSQVATGEKLDDNTGLIMEASTITEKGRDDYETIPLFRTYDCNVEKIDGKLKITAMKGDIGFNPKEKDTFVLGMPYYHKAWEQDGYLYYSRSDTQHEGYVLCPEARKTDGMRNFCLYGKYVAGRNSQGTLGSYYGVNPTRSLPSYNNNITEAKKRGDEYCFGSSYDYAYIQTTFLLKYANKNWNNVLGGCFTYSSQYLISIPESNTKRVVLKKTEADKFLIGSCVIVGDSEDGSKAPDRSATVAYNLCDSAKILDIVEVDTENKALVLDIASNITTTATTWVSTIHWESGFSDDILGRDGCPCQTKSQISSMLYPSVIQGIELMVGGYEVPGNTFMDIVDGLTRDVYVCTDSTKLTTNVTTAKETYVKLAKQMTVERNNEWNYGTEIFIDTENGMNIITKAGASGSGTSTGFCDGIYFDTAETEQREFLLLGFLWGWGASGAFCAYCYCGLGNTWWNFLARLSLSVFRGEFA